MSVRPTRIAGDFNNSDSKQEQTSINLPELRTRTVVVDHSLQSQWRGTSGRPHNESALVSDRQRLYILLGLFLLSTLFILTSLYYSAPISAHPGASLTHSDIQANPHMLRHYNRLMSSSVANIAASKTASPYSVLYVTVPSLQVAEKLSTGLLTNRLIACANILPSVTSMYWWEGKIQKESELLIMMKTQSSLFPEVAKYVKENHPYQVPEIIELPIQQGHKEYLEWIGENTKEMKLTETTADATQAVTAKSDDASTQQ